MSNLESVVCPESTAVNKIQQILYELERKQPAKTIGETILRVPGTGAGSRRADRVLSSFPLRSLQSGEWKGRGRLQTSNCINIKQRGLVGTEVTQSHPGRSTPVTDPPTTAQPGPRRRSGQKPMYEFTPFLLFRLQTSRTTGSREARITVPFETTNMLREAWWAADGCGRCEHRVCLVCVENFWNRPPGRNNN